MNKTEESHTISKMVAMVYCEQKAVFDFNHGDARPAYVRDQAEEGIRQHATFETAGRKHRSAPCYVATRVFGDEAIQTEFLRSWRDAVLMPRFCGRLLVHAYYLISPPLLRCVSVGSGLELSIRHTLELALKLGYFDHGCETNE